MIYDMEPSTQVVDYLRQNGVFIYVNTGKTEPSYIAAPGKSATIEDVRAAINFLTTIHNFMKAGEA